MLQITGKVSNGCARRYMLAFAPLVMALPLGAAHASTIATFDWVSKSTNPTPPITTPHGDLVLTLPGTVTGNTFAVGNSTSAAAAAQITGFSYTFGDGLTVGLSNITSKTIGQALVNGSPSFAWLTSNSVTPAGTTSPAHYLITGFQLAGSKVFPGDPRAANFNIANAAGQAALVASDSNGITPFAGQGSATGDAGYWKLDSLVPVPLPAAAGLLLGGLGALCGAFRRRLAA
jgi:hypothetical protein